MIPGVTGRPRCRSPSSRSCCAQGVPFARTPETAMEYSNLGFALLGRIITNVSGQPYADTITRSLLQPLGMQASGFFVDAAPRERRALGLPLGRRRLAPRADAHARRLRRHGRHPDQRARLRQVGGVPAVGVATAGCRGLRPGETRDRARARARVQLSRACDRAPGTPALRRARQAATYGMGLWVAVDCDLGLTLSHGGGYPGYGSHVLLLPDHGAAHVRVREPHLCRPLRAGLGCGDRRSATRASSATAPSQSARNSRAPIAPSVPST